jgi:hypothetical protein
VLIPLKEDALPSEPDVGEPEGPPLPPAPTAITYVVPPTNADVPDSKPPAPPPPGALVKAVTLPPPPAPATFKYETVGLDDADTTPKVLVQEFVAVFSSCTEAPGIIAGFDTKVRLPLAYTETPDTPRRIVVVPKFTIVIVVPIGKATDAFVGIVIVCAPVLAE